MNACHECEPTHNRDVRVLGSCGCSCHRPRSRSIHDETTTGLALLVLDDGSYRVESFAGTADDLRGVLGGWLEAAPADEHVTIWVNEEGKLLGLPVNRLAMDVWIRWDVHHCMLVGRDWLAGNVVVTGGAGRRGETLPLPDDARRWVLLVARDAGAEIAL